MARLPTTAPAEKGLVEPTRQYGPADPKMPCKGLAVLLHGAGGNADHMLWIAEEWAAEMPQVAFLMPSAPVRGQLSAWFARTPGKKCECCGFDTITRQLLELVEHERARLGLELGQVAFLGYSAGALMAGWLTLQLPVPCAGLVLLHGLAPDRRLPPPPHHGAGRPPALALAGESDAQIPPRAVELAVEALKTHGFTNIAHHVERGQGHAPSDNELRLMCQFLKDRLS